VLLVLAAAAAAAGKVVTPTQEHLGRLVGEAVETLTWITALLLLQTLALAEVQGTVRPAVLTALVAMVAQESALLNIGAHYNGTLCKD
jgi:hypothetical protein